jgi:hypothetical protein
MAGRE